MMITIFVDSFSSKTMCMHLAPNALRFKSLTVLVLNTDCTDCTTSVLCSHATALFFDKLVQLVHRDTRAFGHTGLVLRYDLRTMFPLAVWYTELAWRLRITYRFRVDGLLHVPTYAQ